MFLYTAKLKQKNHHDTLMIRLFERVVWTPTLNTLCFVDDVLLQIGLNCWNWDKSNDI